MKLFAAAIFLLIGGLIAFNTHAAEQCTVNTPGFNGPFPYNYTDGSRYYRDFSGCEFSSTKRYPMKGWADGPWMPTGRNVIGGIPFGSLISLDKLTASSMELKCASRPPLLKTYMSAWWRDTDREVYAYYNDCEYHSNPKGYPGIDTPDGYLSDWYPTGRVMPGATKPAPSPGEIPKPSPTPVPVPAPAPAPVPAPVGAPDSTDWTSSGTGWDSVGFPDTGGTGWGSGGTSGTGGSSGSSTNPGSSGNPGSSSGSGSVFPDYGITSQPGSKPGETVTTFTQPLPAPVPYGEPTSQEIKNYAVDFFIYKKECGNSCLTYFDTHQPPFTPVGCMDLAFNLNVPHKKPDCRSDDIAWYDKEGRFIEFKYRLTDKARHDIINKLKGDFGTVSSGGANYFNVPLSPRGEINANYTSRLNFYDDKTPYEMLSYNNYSLMQIDKRLLLLGLTTDSSLNNLKNLNDELKGFHHDFLTYYKPDNYGYPGTVSVGGTGAGSGSSDGDGVLAELQSFHHDSDKYDAQLLDRLNTDNLDSEANSSVSKLSTSLKGLLSGQHVGGEFEEASQLMGQIGNGSDSPLLGKFLDSKLIPIVDTRRCDMPVFGRGTEWEFTLNSVYLYKLKQILTFIMYALTFWYLFDMLTNVGGRD